MSLLPFDSKLKIFGFVDKTRYLNTSSWALRNTDRHFSTFSTIFSDQAAKQIIQKIHHHWKHLLFAAPTCADEGNSWPYFSCTSYLFLFTFTNNKPYSQCSHYPLTAQKWYRCILGCMYHKRSESNRLVVISLLLDWSATKKTKNSENLEEKSN